MDDPKSFFARPTPAEIRKDKEPFLLEDKIYSLKGLAANQYAVISEKAFTARFGFGDAAKFLKHGETFHLRNNRPVGKTPKSLIKEAVIDPQISFNTFMSGYSFKPCFGPDKIPRRVPFVELLEAARILAYGVAHPEADVKVEGMYAIANKARIEGGSFLVSTSSRTKRHDRYRFMVNSVPMHYSEPFVYLVPYNFSTSDLGVESKAFRELRFTKAESPEPSKVNYIQAHEIAAAYAIAEKQSQEGNPLPLRFLVFPIVSQSAVDLYTTLLNRTLLQVEDEGKVKLKHLTQAHIEAMMWRQVRGQGYAAGFDDTALLEGRVREYNWNHVQA
ncbi:MAG: hypothetical protein AABY40_04270 [Nanoarchaeota archaeon]